MESREQQLRFAAKHGDRATFDRLGGSDAQWGQFKAMPRAAVANLVRGVV